MNAADVPKNVVPRLEGRVIYLSPAQFAVVNRVVADSLPGDDTATMRALAAIGLPQSDIEECKFKVTRLQVETDAERARAIIEEGLADLVGKLVTPENNAIAAARIRARTLIMDQLLEAEKRD